MPFLLAEILNFQGTEHLIGVGSLSNLLVQQVNHYSGQEKRLRLAKAFIEGATYNIYRNLRYYNGRGKDVQTYMDMIEGLRKQISKA